MKDITQDEDFQIRIQFVPADQMRYDTLGDYRWAQGELLVQIANGLDFMESMAILLHELAEWAIVHRDGMPLSKVDQWDLSHPNSEEPGEEPGCPYGEAHAVAMRVERAFRNRADPCIDPTTPKEQAMQSEIKRTLARWEEANETDSASKYLHD